MKDKIANLLLVLLLIAAMVILFISIGSVIYKQFKKEVNKVETKVNHSIVITLELNQREARWLHEMTQNSMYQEPELEPLIDKQIRESFFKATDIDNLNKPKG